MSLFRKKNDGYSRTGNRHESLNPATVSPSFFAASGRGAAISGRPEPVRAPSDPMLSAFWLLLLTASLICFGLTMLYSASFLSEGMKFFVKQLVWIAIGVTGGGAVYFFGFRAVARLRLVWIVASCVLLLIARFGFAPINGAYRWIRIAGNSIQPSEFAKLAVAYFVAGYCAEHSRTFMLLRDRYGLLPLAGISGMACGLIFLGKDWGTTILVVSMAGMMMMAAGLYWRYIVPPALLLFLGGAFYILTHDAMRLGRITSFLDPEAVQEGKGYQLINSLMALGSGGWFGVGFSQSRLKTKYLPECHTDFILSVVGEELGLFSILCVIALYCLWAFFALRIALRSQSRLGMLLGFGIMYGIFVQALINLAVVAGGAPTKGMPAPFISYGGSNIVACLLGVGTLVSIAAESADPEYTLRLRRTVRERIAIWKKR